MGWSRYVQEPFGGTCSIDWTSDLPADLAYTIVLCFTCYGFHVVIMALCYTRVWQVWAHTKNSLSQSNQRIHANSSHATRIGIFSSMKLNKVNIEDMYATRCFHCCLCKGFFGFWVVRGASHSIESKPVNFSLVLGSHEPVLRLTRHRHKNSLSNELKALFLFLKYAKYEVDPTLYSDAA